MKAIDLEAVDLFCRVSIISERLEEKRNVNALVSHERSHRNCSIAAGSREQHDVTHKKFRFNCRVCKIAQFSTADPLAMYNVFYATISTAIICFWISFSFS